MKTGDTLIRILDGNSYFKYEYYPIAGVIVGACEGAIVLDRDGKPKTIWDYQIGTTTDEKSEYYIANEETLIAITKED